MTENHDSPPQSKQNPASRDPRIPTLDPQTPQPARTTSVQTGTSTPPPNPADAEPVSSEAKRSADAASEAEYARNGLTSRVVAERTAAGQTNVATDPPTKTVGQIVCSHVFTLFNLLNFVLAALVILVGSWKNLMFMGVVLSNIVIGIYQELRAKATIDQLTLLTAPRVRVLRDGEEGEVRVEELVRDDLILLESGDQIPADAIVLDGDAEINEALLTGEADPITRRRGDELRSGSFVAAGRCRAVVEHVGAENYVAKLTERAKQLQKPRSALMDAVRWIIRLVSYLIVPLGVLMFCKQYFGLGKSVQDAVVSMVSSAVGMIPEGLVLLTSVSLAVGVIKLASRRTLVQEMYSIESLARVDTLCLDKTGTITEGHMRVEQVLPLTPADPVPALTATVHALNDRNPTAQALREAYPKPPGWQATELLPFSSARKYSAARFREGCFALGAPEFLLADRGESLRAQIAEFADAGKRVLVFCETDAVEGADMHPRAVALLVLSDRVRADAAETFAYFRSQGVDIRVISGDSASTVAAAAREAGLEVRGAVDLDGRRDEEVASLALRNTVFGRVTPNQKCVLIEALKQSGHTVAMTGDGVNDVLALKAADCSIAMAAGSAAARHVSQLVLLDSNFASLPRVVAEGRRVVNNMRRASSLYLVKTVYSALLTLAFLFLGVAWPFQPIQMTLIGAVTVGIPSFFLALEPNDERVRSDFLPYVLTHALPGALAIVLGVFALLIARLFLPVTDAELSTLCAITTGFVGFVVLFGVCVPFDWKRILLYSVMFGAYTLIIMLFGSFFALVPLPPNLWPLLLASCTLVAMLTLALTRLTNFIYTRWKKRTHA